MIYGHVFHGYFFSHPSPHILYAENFTNIMEIILIAVYRFLFSHNLTCLLSGLWEDDFPSRLIWTILSRKIYLALFIYFVFTYIILSVHFMRQEFYFHVKTHSTVEFWKTIFAWSVEKVLSDAQSQLKCAKST